MRKQEREALDKEKQVLDTLKTHGPLAPSALQRESNIGAMSPQGFRKLLDRLEAQEQIIVFRKNGERKVVRLPGQALEIPATRFKNRHKPIGPEVPDEMVQRALDLFESGVICGTFGLSEKLGITHGEAIAVVGRLFASGRIKGYSNATYKAVVPHRQPKEAA